MNTKSFLTAAALVASTVSFSAQASDLLDPNLPVYNKVSGVSGNLSSVGSDTLANLMTLWAEEFKRNYPNVNIQIQAAGSSTAPPALLAGTSLIGGPLVIAVALRHIKMSAFRHPLFVLWVVLVSIKLIAFAWAGISLNLLATLWLLPFAGIGHLIGQRLHEQLLRQDTTRFYRIIGWILLMTAGAGLYQVSL